MRVICSEGDMTDVKLTPKQARFVEEYLVDLNATQAAIRAGYSKNTAREIGCENLTKPNLQKAIQEKQKARSKRTEITQDYVINTVVETIDRCRQARPVLDRKGEQVYVETDSGEIKPAFTFDANAVLRGSEILGKHLGMFTEQVEVSHTGNVNLQVIFSDETG